MYIQDSIRKITDKGLKESSSTLIPEGTLVLVSRVSLGKMAFIKKPTAINQDLTAIIFNEKLVNKTFAYFYLKSIAHIIEENGHGATVKGITRNFLKDLEIPLPPLEIQQQIVSEIECYQKIIDGAKQVVKNYKPVISVDPEWKQVQLKEILGKVGKNIEPKNERGPITYIGLENIEQGTGRIIGEIDNQFEEIKSTKLVFNVGNVLYGKLRPNLNKVWLADRNGICSTDFLVLKFNKLVAKPEFYSKYFLSDKFNSEVIIGIQGAQLPRVSFEYFSSIKVPLPPIEIQKLIVKSIEEEMQHIDSNKKLIQLFEAKVKRKIAEVWGVKEVSPIGAGEKLSLAAEEKANYKTKQKRNASIA